MLNRLKISKLTRFSAVGLLVALVGATPMMANAATRYEVTNNVSSAGGGVYLQNTTSGYYMGRLFVGQHFDAQRKEIDERFNNAYYFGYAVGRIGGCMWIGPPASERNFNPFNGSPTSTVDDRCPASGPGSSDWLRDRDNIGTSFNCPEHQATGPQLTTTNDAAGFYYSIDWNSDYSGGSAIDPPVNIGPGTAVLYRFSTRNHDKAVVYLPGYGWGFILASKVNVVSGAWGPASDDPAVYSQQRPCGAE
jgi:hypothetical protein